ncbi:hypothetical protein SAMN06264365_11981 [Actinoplanes regularis]|uniref:Uncharacterized protein n=1 Tax=Actinoplanes regularis TaxID=52697 RepID=A0A239FWR5_9ACTN|nr:hypothetical protein SAMN06264365_11981 [Actinoplanes regularis]
MANSDDGTPVDITWFPALSTGRDVRPPSAD